MNYPWFLRTEQGGNPVLPPFFIRVTTTSYTSPDRAKELMKSFRTQATLEAQQVVAVAVLLVSLLLVGSCKDRTNQDLGVLWKAYSENGNTILLVPTIHSSPIQLGIPDALQREIDQATLLAVEVNTEDLAVAIQVQACSVAFRENRRSVPVSASDTKKMSELLSKYRASVDPINPTNPLNVADQIGTAVLSDMGYRKSNGIDVSLIKHAKRRKLAIESIEQPCYALDLVDRAERRVPNLEFADYLAAQIPPWTDYLAAGFLQDWRSGTFEVMGERAAELERRYPYLAHFHREAIQARNSHIADQIVKLSKREKRLVVAVGALHFVGTDSVNALLANRGVSVFAVGQDGVERPFNVGMASGPQLESSQSR